MEDAPRPTENDRLAALERQVEAGMADAGRALLELQQSRLWLLHGGATFGDYVEVRFRISRSTAYKMIRLEKKRREQAKAERRARFQPATSAAPIPAEMTTATAQPDPLAGLVKRLRRLAEELAALHQLGERGGLVARHVGRALDLVAELVEGKPARGSRADVEPVEALPGTPAKSKAMASRAADGYLPTLDGDGWQARGERADDAGAVIARRDDGLLDDLGTLRRGQHVQAPVPAGVGDD